LKLNCDEPLSNVAFKFNSRRYIEALAGGLLPLLIRRVLANSNRLMSLLNAFSGGVFLSAVGRCRLKPVLKAPPVSTLEAKI
jgi:hypothetical protein